MDEGEPRTKTTIGTAVLLVALVACGRGGTPDAAPATSASTAAPVVASGAPVTTTTSTSVASAAPPSSSASAPADGSRGPAPPTATFVGTKKQPGCNTVTVQLASYQDRGEISLGGNASALAATWRVHLAGKPQEQVAFAAFDTEGKQIAKTRGVGGTVRDVPPRVFASGSEWTVVWFDAKGLAYTRPKADAAVAPDVLHLGAVTPDTSDDVALAASPRGAVLATTPFGVDHAQLGLFLFGGEQDLALVNAVGVTHHGKHPHRAAVAASDGGMFVAWDEGGSLVASHFDGAGKESDAPCPLAPAAGKPERLALAVAGAGAVASWMEGTHVMARGLDSKGCPVSPASSIGEGRWASLATLGDSAVVTWVAPDGRLLAARLAADGAPSAKGLDVAEGSTGARDTPSVLGFGAGKVAFAWAERMSPTVKTKRLQLRIVDAACIP